LKKNNNYFLSPSIFIIFLPYFLFYFNYDFDIQNFLVVILIFLVDKYLYQNFNFNLKILILFIINICFYCLNFYYDSFHVIHELRLRYFLLLYSFVISIFYLTINKNRSLIKIHNAFFIILSITYLFRFSLEYYNQTNFSKIEFLKRIDFNYTKLNLSKTNSNQPILLIILDEYASSNEVFNYTKSDVDKEFDLSLLEMGFLIKSEFESKTQRTTFSLPSIFNFNFHNNKIDSIQDLDIEFKRVKGFDNLLEDNLLIDSLNSKNVKSFSYGLMSFLKGEPSDSSFYHWWNDQNPDSNFISIFFRHSIFYFIQNEFFKKHNYIDLFRKDALNSLERVSFQNSSFYYFHLYFPHDPYSYYEEYPYVDLNYPIISQEKYVDEYIKYRRWFLSKFQKILKNKKFDNTRIIIVGDHGFRHHKSFSPLITSGYFKGFKSDDLDKIKSVQDLGYLINSSF